MNARFLCLAWLLLVSGAAGAQPSPDSALRFFESRQPELQPVDPEKAFRIEVTANGPDRLSVRFDVDECCYLYRHRTKLELRNAPNGFTLGTYQLPPGKAKTDEFLGNVEVWEQPVSIDVPVNDLARAGGATLVVGYQGCATTPIAICYSPTTKEFALAQITASATTASESNLGAASDQSFVAYLLGAFGFGLLLTFTPCVLPMVPILSSAIVRAGERSLTKWEGGLLSYCYVLGTAVTLAGVGYLAGATGMQLQSYFQTPWAIGAFSLLLVALALSMLGIFHLQIPHAIQSFLHHHGHRLHHHTRHVRGRTYLGVFTLGLLSALIIGACATPILLTALSVAMERGDPVLGAAIMFTLAHGQGIILIALGVGAGFLLPKAGPWMEIIKHGFAVLLVAAAIYLLGALPGVPVLLLWGVFLLAIGIFLITRRGTRKKSSGWRRIGLTLAILSILWGVAAFVGGFLGNRDIVRPLAGIGKRFAAAAPLVDLTVHQVRSLTELEQQLRAARGASRPVLVDYYADWCLDCVRMENTTFQDAAVRRALQPFTVVRADITDTTTADATALRKRFNVYAPPALVLLDNSGQHRVFYGFRSADDLIALLRTVSP